MKKADILPLREDYAFSQGELRVMGVQIMAMNIAPTIFDSAEITTLVKVFRDSLNQYCSKVSSDENQTS